MLSLAWPCVRARAAKEMRGVMLVWVMVVMLLVEATVGLPSLPLTTKGNIVVDADGNRVKFAGVCLPPFSPFFLSFLLFYHCLTVYKGELVWI